MDGPGSDDELFFDDAANDNAQAGADARAQEAGEEARERVDLAPSHRVGILSREVPLS